jgi:hypothetical protein
LIWSGLANTTDFNTAFNWIDSGTGEPATAPPGASDTVDLSGAGSITNFGDVAEIDVSNPSGSGFTIVGTFLAGDGVSDLGLLAFDNSDVTAGPVSVGAGATSGTLSLDNSFLASSAVSVGATNGASLGLTDSTLEGLGAVNVGGDGEQGSLQSAGSTISAGELIVDQTGSGLSLRNSSLAVTTALELTNGATGNLQDTTLSIGSFDVTALLVSGNSDSDAAAVLTAQASQLSIGGAVAIGTLGAGDVTLTASTLTTGQGVTVGGTGGQGTLALAGHGAWTDFGNVAIGTGSLLQCSEAGKTTGYAFIHGILAIQDGTADLSGRYTLAAGAVALDGAAAEGGAIFELTDGAVLRAHGIILRGDSVLAINAGATTAATDLHVSTSFTVGAGASFSLRGGRAAIGSNVHRTAASVSGTWVQHGAAVTLQGGLSLTGGSLTLQAGSTLGITSTGLAIAAHDATISLTDTTNAITATGGIELLAGSTLSMNGGTITATGAAHHDALLIDPKSALTGVGAVQLTGNVGVGGTLASSHLVLGGGTLAIAAGGLLSGAGTISSAVHNAGTIDATAGSLTLSGPIYGTGTLALGNNGALILLGAVEKIATVAFAAAGTITLGDVGAFHADLAGWASGDTLDLLNLAAATDSVSGQSLTLYGSTHDKLAVLHFSQPITAGKFSLGQDGHGDTLLRYHG